MTLQKSLSGRAWIELLLLGLIWGASFLSIRIALDEIGPLTVVTHRVFWAMLVMAALVAVARLPLPRSPKVWVGFLGMGLLNNVIPFALIAWGQLHVETGLTSILNATTAVFGVIVAAIWFADERMTWRKSTGVLLGFVGVATAIGLGSARSFDVTNLAQLAILAGTLSYALAGVWARHFLGNLPPQVAAFGMLAGASVVMVPLAWVIEGPPSLALAPRTWSAIAYFALVATAGAYLLYYRVLAMAGSGNLLLVTLFIPPVAIGLGAAVRAETLGPNAYAGFALLVLGLLVLDGRLWRRIVDRQGP